MQAIDVVNQLREDIEGTKNAGHASIDPDLLLARLKVFEGWIEEDDAQDANHQEATAALNQQSAELGLDYTRQNHEWDLEAFRAVIAHGQGALKACLLVAGGGAAALLAFLGSLVSSESEHVAAVAGAIMWMVWAVIAAAISIGSTYLSQWLYSESSKKLIKLGGLIQVLAILSFLASLSLFGWGAWKAQEPFSKHQIQASPRLP